MVIGLTGGIASGKSSILNIFKKLGYTTLELDKIAHELLLDENVKNEILFRIDKNILDENKKIDRKKLGDIVFLDDSKLKILNEIIHKRVIDIMDAKIFYSKQNNIDLIVEFPLLFELNMEYKFDKTILAYVDKKTQIQRIKLRDNKTGAIAKKIIESQLKNSEKKKRANILINTKNSIENISAYIFKEFGK